MDRLHRPSLDEVAIERAPDPTNRVGVIEHLQQTAGNAAVAQMLAPVQRLDAGSETAGETELLEGDPAAKERPMIKSGSAGPSVAEAQVRLNAPVLLHRWLRTRYSDP